MKLSFRKVLAGERGASMIEYALLVSLVAMISLTAVMLAGARVSDSFDGIAAQMESNGAGPGDDGVSGGSDPEDPSNPGDVDPGNPGDEDPEDPGTPGGNDLEPGDPVDEDPEGPVVPENPEDPEGPGVPENPEDPGQPGDEDPPGSIVEVSDTDAQFYWWNDTRQGGEGEWKASVTFTNDTNRHQYLDLVIVLTDHSGSPKSVNVSGFYVPANGSASYEHWSNSLKLVNGKLIGVLAVEFKVMKITTSDENWKPVTYDLGGVTVAKVEAPLP